MKFSGIRAPQLDAPLIEFETTSGRLIDLYNEHKLRSAVLRGDELAFEFILLEKAPHARGDEAPFEWQPADPPVTTTLQFLGVRNLRVAQPEDWAQGEADQVEHLLVRGSGPWPRIVFMAGGFEYEFDCEELCLTVELSAR